MAAFDEESLLGAPRSKPAAHAIGENIDDLSARELAERIAALQAEIARLEGAIRARESTREAASAFFKA